MATILLLFNLVNCLGRKMVQKVALNGGLGPLLKTERYRSSLLVQLLLT